MILQRWNIQENFDCLVSKKPFLFLSLKKRKHRHYYCWLKTEWEGVADDLKHASFFLFLKIYFALVSLHLFPFIFFFPQANFTFGFVENLKTYSEMWLRMSEIFKTSRNVLTVSRLQVGELWEIFLTFCCLI